jgi:hypothetical protein
MLDCLARIEDPKVNLAMPLEQEYKDTLLPYQDLEEDPLWEGMRELM